MSLTVKKKWPIYFLEIIRRFISANYDFAKACAALIPNSATKPGEVNVGPKFFRDELEDWSKAEVQLFEEGNQKFQKGKAYAKVGIYN